MNNLKNLKEEYKKSSDKLFWKFKKELDELTRIHTDKLNRIKDR